jgi:hypothetical protein
MFCTNCGASEQSLKTYCRKCGKWIGVAPPDERLSVMIVFNALSALFGIVSAIALWITYVGSVGAKWSIYVAFTFCLVISVYQILSSLFAINLRRRLKQGQKIEVTELRETRNTNELPAGDSDSFIAVNSITENTTELLERKR